MFPMRLSLVTYNLWNTERWPLRAPALRQFADIFRPDVLCLQELRAETQAYLDTVMPRHTRIHDTFPGWTCEGNIYWHRGLFREVDHGAEDVGILEVHRRLFWVRLQPMDHQRTILVSTAHFTYQGHPQEIETGVSPRLAQVRRTIAVLQRLVRDDEPAWFMGDLNDPALPVQMLHEAGYMSCFAALGVQCPPTFPCYPTANVASGARVTNQTIDWIVANRHTRVIAAQVPHCYSGDIAPSDHWPVLAVYEIEDVSAL
jgi:endonuclease/exonuclease/phosphatase family metal-dependent hydrolase